MVSTHIIRPAIAPSLLPGSSKLDINSLKILKIPDHNGITYSFKSVQDFTSHTKGLLHEREIGKLLLAYSTKDLDQTNLTSLIKKVNGEICLITLKDEVIKKLDETYSDENSFFMINKNGYLVIIAACFFDEPHHSDIMSEKAGFPIYRPWLYVYRRF